MTRDGLREAAEMVPELLRREGEAKLALGKLRAVLRSVAWLVEEGKPEDLRVRLGELLEREKSNWKEDDE